jgi:hypothetical protein
VPEKDVGHFSEYFLQKEMRTTKKYMLKGRPSPRSIKAGFTLSEEEYDVISFYLKKYKISNRSRWFRETILNHVLKTMDMDYPTLFGENEMRR